MNNSWMKVGALLAAAAVVFGAFGAPGLQGFLETKYSDQTRNLMGTEIPAAHQYLDDFEIAARYQMTHAVAIMIAGLQMAWRPRRSLTIAAWCFSLGILFFSGSLYALVLTGIGWLGAISPIGGVLMIIGWLAMVEGCCPGRSESCPSPSNELRTPE